jgi:hypothetical protein
MTSVFDNIQTFELFFFGYSQADSGLQDPEEEITATERPDKGGTDTNELYTDKMGGHSLNVEESSGQSSPGDVYAVHRDGTDWIIDTYAVKEQNGEDHECPGNGSDDDGTAW